MSKVFIQTFGCQMNVKDSERALAFLKRMNFEQTQEPKEADLILLNTCAVREKPEHKVYSEAGRFKRLKEKNPKLKIGILGCVAQLYGKELIKRLPFVDFILGTQNLHRLPEIVSCKEQIVEVSENLNPEERFLSPILEKERVSAFITIQEGCSKECTFCVVPITRGKEISRKPNSIIEEIKSLVERGVKEVTLIGQNVNSWGKEIGWKFSELLRNVNKIDGLLRIRFTTSNPQDVTDDLLLCFKELEKLCEHIHLPVQSGSNKILKRMKRPYTREEYLKIIKKLRETKPEIAITTDIIVGFPGETEKDFEETLSLVREVEFDDFFSFVFSPRPKTLAETFQDRVPKEEASKRLHILQEIQDEITMKKMKSFVGRLEKVLVEVGNTRYLGDVCGRTRTNKIVHFKGGGEIYGKEVEVLIEEAFRNALRGRLIKTAV